MTEPRFTVRWCRGIGIVLRPGYAVFDHGCRITIVWQAFGEAERQCRRIAETYARFGW